MTVQGRLSGFLLLLTFSVAPPLIAQTVSSTPEVDSGAEEDSPRDAYLLGMGIGAGGFLVGGSVGLLAASGCESDDYCAARGFLIGAAIGGTLGMAFGVHLGNDRKGSLPLDMLTGAGIWGIGIGAAALTGWDDTATLIAAIGVPIVQLFSTVAVERATGRSRAARKSFEVSIGPNLQGGATFAASIRF